MYEDIKETTSRVFGRLSSLALAILSSVKQLGKIQAFFLFVARLVFEHVSTRAYEWKSNERRGEKPKPLARVRTRTHTLFSIKSRMDGSMVFFKAHVVRYHWSRANAPLNTRRNCNAHARSVLRLVAAEIPDGRRQVFLDAPLHVARTSHVHEHRVTNTSWFAFVSCPISSFLFRFSSEGETVARPN